MARDEDGDGVDDGDAADEQLGRMAKRGVQRGVQRGGHRGGGAAAAKGKAAVAKAKKGGRGRDGASPGSGGSSGMMVAPPRREQRVQGGAPPPPGSGGMMSAPRSEKSPSPSLPPSERSPGRSPGRRGSGQKPKAQHHRGITRGAGDTSSNTTDEDWATLAAKLPVGISDEDKKKRRKLFNDFDPNGNGYLSLAEVDLGVRKALNSDALFNAKPAIMRAFQAAKDSVNTGSKLGPDFVVRQTSRFYFK